MYESNLSDKIHHVFEMCIGHLRLNHPKLGEVAASLGFLSAKRWTKAVCLSERCGGRFVVELARLR